MSQSLFVPMTVAVLGLFATGCDDASSVDSAVLEHGKDLAQNCKACHSLDSPEVIVGPSLDGVVGRRAGSEGGFEYSSALASSGIVWDEERLAEFIRHPQGVVPGTKMIGEKMAEADAKAIAAYLDSIN